MRIHPPGRLVFTIALALAVGACSDGVSSSHAPDMGGAATDGAGTPEDSGPPDPDMSGCAAVPAKPNPSLDTLKGAEVAIWNAYYGCDPNAGKKACSATNPGVSDSLSTVMGRPVRQGTDGYFCPGRLSHARCGVFVSAPVVGKAPAAMATDRQAYRGVFEFGWLVAYLEGKRWRVRTLVDRSEGAFLALYLGQKKKVSSQDRWLLGLPTSHSLKAQQTFRAGCCFYTAALDSKSKKVTLTGAGKGCAFKSKTVSQPHPVAPKLDWKLNGNQVSTSEEQALRYVARRVVPGLRSLLGSRGKALDGAAVVSWWSLKEGVFGTTNPIAFSLCDRPREVLTGKPAGICKKHAWQVGMGAVQAPRPPGSPSNWFTKPIATYVATYEAQAKKCFPGQTAVQILRRAASEAGYTPGGGDEKTVTGAKDFVRAAWLLRVSAVGYAQQIARVTSECITGDKSWCHGTKWSTTKKYAPTKSAAAAVRAKIKTLLDALAPL